MAVAPATSWALVTTIPSSRTTTPQAVRVAVGAGDAAGGPPTGLTRSVDGVDASRSSVSPARARSGVTFTRSMTRSGSTDRLPVTASTPPHSTAPTKPATSAIGHTGGRPLRLGARSRRAATAAR